MKRLSRKQALGHNRSVDLTDQARDCCDNIATVAALLETYGVCPGPKIVGDRNVAHSGIMISREAAKLRGLVDALDQSENSSKSNRKRGHKGKKGT